jgi:hypothetical protein
MARGRSLRRRRQLGVAASGAGGALAVALVAVLLVGGSGSDDQNERIVADDPTTTVATTTSTTAPPAEMRVELVPGPPAAIRVVDPAQPAAEGTEQCLTVSIRALDAPSDAAAVAEGTMCAPGVSSDGVTDLALVLTTSSESGSGPVEIGCAPSVERPAPAAVASTETRPGSTTFVISAPDLPPAEYQVVVSAVSGIGDGCAPQQAGFERENVADGSGTMQLP